MEVRKTSTASSSASSAQMGRPGMSIAPTNNPRARSQRTITNRLGCRSAMVDRTGPTSTQSRNGAPMVIAASAADPVRS